MATLFTSSPHLILRRLLHSLLPPCPFLQSKQSLPFKTTPSPAFPRTLSFSPCPRATPLRLEDGVAVMNYEQTDWEIEINSGADTASDGLGRGLGSKIAEIRGEQLSNPSLSVKEKKELASYAHSLGKKLKSQQVGKSGVTDTVVTALIETLEANELLKLKIHGTCPGEFDDLLEQLEVATGSVIVGQIGRTVILYRPSVAKLKAEEKKKQVQRVYLKRQSMSKQSPSSERFRPKTGPGQEQRKFDTGRQGSTRF